MKIKQMAERLNSVPVRKKAKRILAVTLAVLMVNPVTGYGVSAHAQEAHTITAFSELSGKIASQLLAVGAEESDINLPDTLNVTVGVSSADTAESIVKDSQAEEIPTKEVKPDESNLEEPAADESPSDDSSVSGNDAEEPQEDGNSAEDNTATDSQATVVLDSGDVPLAATTTGSAISADLDDADDEQTETEKITSEERTLTGITWQINAERSGSDTFDSESVGAVFFYEPVLPEGYTLADGVSLPQIQVQIEESVRWAFSQSQTIDGIEITVKAEKDVFPEGAVLHAEKVTSAEDKERIQSAVSEEVQSVDTAKTVTKLVSFDITITDVDGNELQPDTSKGEVRVSFSQLPMVTEDTASTQELKVFHMDDNLSEATGLDTTVDEVAETVEATAEHFSVYTVAQLTDGIRATVEAEIKASDGTLTYYDTIEEAITAAMGMNGSTVTLLKDVQTETFFTVSSGTFFIDLNGNTWHCTYIYGMALNLEGSADSRVSITFKDSAGNGSFTTDGSYSVYKQGYATAIFEGGSYGGIACYETVGNLLAEGYVYRNNIDGLVVTDTSGKNIYNVTVTPAPVKITAQPEDAVATPGYTEAPTFSIMAETMPEESGETITYQWYKDSVAIDSATNASYTVEPNLGEGTYTYYCAVTCDGYTVNTENATLFVTSATGNYEVTSSGGLTFKYPTLETAITVAKSKPNSTVKLLADATTSDTVEVSSGTFTIDLNGKIWTSNASAAALNITNGCHVTLMDSAAGGKITTSTASLTIRTHHADLTIKSGIYENENDNSMSCVLVAYYSGTVTIQGGTIQTSKSVVYLVYLQSVDVVISGGTFSGGTTAFDNCDSVALSGGQYKYISTAEKSIVASLLASGYGYKNVSNSTWVNRLSNPTDYANDLSHTFLQYAVTVERMPLEIINQPTAPESVVYGYSEAPEISMYADRTDYAPTGSNITYRLWKVKSGEEAYDSAVGEAAYNNHFTLPTGLDAGSHQYYIVAECDGCQLRSKTVTFTVEKATPTIELLVFTREDAPFIYENGVYLNAWAKGINGENLDGTVTFKNGDEVIITSSYDSFTKNYSAGKSYLFDAGDHSFTAIYTPSTDGIGKNYIGVTSSAVEQTIAKADQSISITEVDGKKYKDADFTLETAGGKGTGAVTFSVPEGNGVLSIYQKEDGRFDAAIIGAGEVTVTATKAADTNYNEATATQSITIEQADTSIAFQSSYTGNYFYTGSPISNPAEADLSITGASYSDVIFRWSDGYGSILDGQPTTPGNYSLMAVIQGTVNNKESYNIKSVTISFYDSVVPVTYNSSTTKAAWYSADVAITADGYTVSDSANGTYADSYLLSGEGEVSKTLYFKQNGTGYITDGKTITVNIDKTAPAFSADTDGITISDNNWKGFLNNITFGHFFKENKDVSISATDSGSGVDKYYYYIDTGSTTVKTAEELNALSFTEGSSFSIADENKYIIYAYVVDLAGNKSAYICTDGIVIDKTAPTVTLTAPTGSDLGDVSGAAKVKMNETGIISYVIKTTEQSGITALNILDSTEKNTVSVTDVQADTNLDVALSGLTANTTYYMYAVGTDSAQNNGSVVSTSFTTTTTQPVFNDNPTITGIYGQQVKDMTVSQVPSTNGVAGSWSVSSTDKPSVGTTATYDVVFTPDDAVQYATVTVQVTPIVNPKSLTAAGVTIGEVTGTYTYDKTEKVPTVTVTDSDATITASDYEYSYSNNVSAGTAKATVTVNAKGNYTGSVSRTFTIAKAPAPSIDFPTASSIPYGQKLSVSALSVSSTEYGTFAWTDGSTVPTVANGGYEVTFTPNAGTVANYEAITNTTKMVVIMVSKVTPAVTVSADISDDAGSRKATLTTTVTGVGNGETPTGTIKFVNSTSGSDVDIAGATAVIITGGKATYTWTGLAKQIYKLKAVYNGSANYNTATSTELSFDTNKQNQAALNIGSIGTKTYGDGTFTLSATGGSGGGAVTFENSDPSIVSISGTTATIHRAGTVTITATKAANNTYNEVTASVSLTVGKKTLTVKANDQLNIIKGAAMPVLTYTATGLVGSDTFTSPSISTTATDTNTVGEYDITISGGTLANADSYAVTYTNGKLTVVNATYTVTVTNGTGGGSYSEGQTVTITADSRGGYTFTGWSSSDGITFANSTASTTTFTMPGKAVTVTVNYSKNSSGDSGGSSGGGSSSGGSSTSTTTTTPEKKPNQPVTAAAPVTATAGTNGTASASIPDKAVTDAIAKAQSDATSQGKTANGISVELDVTMPKGTASLTATLTRSSLDSLVSAGVSSLEINGSLVQVSFDKKALAEIQKQSSGNISIAIAPKTNLSDAAKKLIGTRPIYDITVGYGSGKSVSSFGGGVATVSIPYTLGKNEAVGGLYGVYVDAKGNANRIAGSTYDTNSGCVIFTTTHFSQYGIGYTAPTAKFTDISTHWAKESVDYVVGRGLLSGTSDTAFSPNSSMTRGMLVTALGRLAGVDTKAYTGNSFTDVNADSAYRPYIEWAYSKGIIQGIGGGQFAPDRAITREEIAAIFANYAKATGYTLPITREASVYADASSIGSAYRDAVKAMQQAGIMMGVSDNQFNPKGNATRAEVSSMLGRYIKLTITPDTAQGWAQNDAGQHLYYKEGKALTGTHTIDGVKYFFNTDGTLKTGWVKDGDNWRFYSGKTMLVGFWDLGANGNNKTYYFTKDGLMVSGKWLEIDGKWYYFYTDGSLARSTKIDSYEVDEKGVRKTK